MFKREEKAKGEYFIYKKKIHFQNYYISNYIAPCPHFLLPDKNSADGSSSLLGRTKMPVSR
jgi:hypothetical protein